jgi:hypothetical protein
VGRTSGTHVGWERCLQVLVERPEGKRPLEIRRRKWEDNIKMGLREIGIDGTNCIRLAQDNIHWRTFVNLRVP